MPKMPRITRGHKSVKKTGMRADIEHTLYKSTIDEFAVRVTEKPEHLGLLEVGYEKVGQKDSLIFLIKRK